MEKVPEEVKFLKGWQLLLTADVLFLLKMVVGKQGSIDNQIPYIIALIITMFALFLLISAVVVGIVNIAKKRQQKPGQAIGFTILGVILLVIYGLA